MAVISIKHFIEAGVHFGHRTRRWSPQMRPYIFGMKNGVHIIDLQKSLRCLKVAHAFVREQCSQGAQVLFVATKHQARGVLEEEAKRCGAFYINERWLGGLMTNFATVKQSIVRLKKLEQMRGEDGSWPGVLKKEASMLEKQRRKLESALGGIKNMRKLPQLLFVIDCKKEHLALQEARRLNIPVVAVVDTNCDPQTVNYPVPGNDDAIRAIRLFSFVISNAVLEGRDLFDAKQREIPPPRTATGSSAKASKQGTASSQPDQAAAEKTSNEALSEVKDQVAKAAQAAAVLDNVPAKDSASVPAKEDKAADTQS